MDKLLNGQVALITGGTAGIGKAIAITFAKQGATVIVCGTNEERGQQVIEEIRQLGTTNQSLFMPLNVTDKQQVQETVQQVLKTFGKVDILVNNAGITRDQLLMKMTEEEWDAVMDTNVKGVFHLCHALVRSMLKAKKGKIINISSVIGLTGNIGQVNYAASKAAIMGFTKALAKELGSRHINVNCIAPGFIETKMIEGLSPEYKQELLKGIPLGCMGKPEDIANAALFLASSLSDYITGQVIPVDGGMVMA